MNLHAAPRVSHAARALALVALTGAPTVSAAAQLPPAAACGSLAGDSSTAIRFADVERPASWQKPALMAWNRRRAFPVVDREGRRLGELRDFVIDRTTGRLSHAGLVVEEDGTGPVKALPLREVRWDAEAQRFRALLSSGGVAALPELSPLWLERLELGTRQIVEAGYHRDEEREPEPPRFLLAGDVEGAVLSASDGRVGTGLGVILDMGPGEVAYFLLGADDEHRQSDLYPVPWTALRATGDRRFGVAKTRAEMAAAPAIPKELIASLTMSGFRRELAAFYGVPSRIDQRLQCLANESGS